MIDWLYQTTVSLSVLIGIVLLIRQVISKYLGANIAYWMWLIPLIHLTSWHQKDVPVALIEKLELSGDKVFLQIIDNPSIYSINSVFIIENTWLVGMVLWAILRFFGWYRFQKNLRKNSTKINIIKFIPASKQLMSNIKVTYYLSDNPQTPFVTGLKNNRIYLPSNYFEKFSKTEQLCILKHEITHIKRNDLGIQLLVEVFRMIYWFNPIIHIAWSAFRQDQELACDYQVLSKSNEKEKHVYGQALLKGLHAHVLPSTLAFFTHHKQRFIMLEKHSYSQLKNVFGIVLCCLLAMFALINAPTTIAVENTSDNKLSFNFNEIKLESIIKLVSDANQKEMTGYENVPDINVSIDAQNVSAQYFEILLLKCSGLKKIKNGKGYRIEKIKGFDDSIKNINQCLQDIKN